MVVHFKRTKILYHPENMLINIFLCMSKCGYSADGFNYNCYSNLSDGSSQEENELKELDNNTNNALQPDYIFELNSHEIPLLPLSPISSHSSDKNSIISQVENENETQFFLSKLLGSDNILQVDRKPYFPYNDNGKKGSDSPSLLSNLQIDYNPSLKRSQSRSVPNVDEAKSQRTEEKMKRRNEVKKFIAERKEKDSDSDSESGIIVYYADEKVKVMGLKYNYDLIMNIEMLTYLNEDSLMRTELQSSLLNAFATSEKFNSDFEFLFIDYIQMEALLDVEIREALLNEIEPSLASLVRRSVESLHKHGFDDELLDHEKKLVGYMRTVLDRSENSSNCGSSTRKSECSRSMQPLSIEQRDQIKSLVLQRALNFEVRKEIFLESIMQLNIKVMAENQYGGYCVFEIKKSGLEECILVKQSILNNKYILDHYDQIIFKYDDDLIFRGSLLINEVRYWQKSHSIRIIIDFREFLATEFTKKDPFREEFILRSQFLYNLLLNHHANPPQDYGNREIRLTSSVLEYFDSLHTRAAIRASIQNLKIVPLLDPEELFLVNIHQCLSDNFDQNFLHKNDLSSKRGAILVRQLNLSTQNAIIECDIDEIRTDLFDKVNLPLQFTGLSNKIELIRTEETIFAFISDNFISFTILNQQATTTMELFNRNRALFQNEKPFLKKSHTQALTCVKMCFKEIYMRIDNFLCLRGYNPYPDVERSENIFSGVEEKRKFQTFSLSQVDEEYHLKVTDSVCVFLDRIPERITHSKFVNCVFHANIEEAKGSAGSEFSLLGNREFSLINAQFITRLRINSNGGAIKLVNSNFLVFEITNCDDLLIEDCIGTFNIDIFSNSTAMKSHFFPYLLSHHIPQTKIQSFHRSRMRMRLNFFFLNC